MKNRTEEYSFNNTQGESGTFDTQVESGTFDISRDGKLASYQVGKLASRSIFFVTSGPLLIYMPAHSHTYLGMRIVSHT